MGGTGNFKQPPEGPKLGPTRDYKDLSDEKKRELGDLAAAARESVFKPVGLDPRVAKAEEEAAADQTWNVDADDRAKQAAETFDALQAVVSKDDEQAAIDEAALAEAALPTDDDKQDFFRAILGNKRYEKTYELFGGMVRATFAELSPREEEDIFTEMGRAQAKGAVTTEDDWMVLFDRLRMLYSITSLQTTGQESYTRSADSDRIVYTDVDRFIGRFNGSIVYQAILHASRLFRRQVEWMTEKALSSDFWRVDGPDSQPRLHPEAPSTTAAPRQPDHTGSPSASSSPA